MNGNRAAGNNHYGREVEGMKSYPRDQAAALHNIQWKSKNVSAVSKVAFQLEMHPAKHQRKGDEGGKNTAPHDQEVHGPTRKAAFEDEPLSNQIGSNRLSGVRSVLHKFLALQVKLPAASPIHTRGRTLQPNGVAKHNRAEGYDAGKRVAKKRRIVVFEIA